MKHHIYSLLAALACLPAAHGSQLSLAVTPVTATPTLIVNFSPDASASSASPQARGVEGTWKGDWQAGGNVIGMKLVISRSQNGYEATMQNLSDGFIFPTESFVVNGDRIEGMFRRGGLRRYAATLDNETGTMAGTWTLTPKGRAHSFHLNLFRVGGATGAPATTSAPSGNVALEDVTHALDVQITERLRAGNIFKLVSEEDLQRGLGQPEDYSNSVAFFDKPGALARCTNAGINFILIPTLEEFQDQDIDQQRQTAQRFHYEGVAGAIRGHRRWAAARADQSAAVEVAETIQRQQRTRLTARCQLIACASGEVRGGVHPFQLDRQFSIDSNGKNAVATSDMVQAAARDIGSWAATCVYDIAYPLKVISLDPIAHKVKLNRGRDTGIAKGQVFEVRVTGKGVVDVNTQVVLPDEEVVGRVAISDIDARTCTADILLEDRGIVIGATCRRATD